MKKLLRDNGLLFDRPWSYWTIEMVVQSGIYMAMRIDEITPLWFAWITALNNAVWVFIFMKGLIAINRQGERGDNSTAVGQGVHRPVVRAKARGICFKVSPSNELTFRISVRPTLKNSMLYSPGAVKIMRTLFIRPLVSLTGNPNWIPFPNTTI